MTRVEQDPHHMGGIGAEPAPASWVEVLGLALFGIVAIVVPWWLWNWARDRFPKLKIEDGPGKEA